jgi:hypothetical protein
MAFVGKFFSIALLAGIFASLVSGQQTVYSPASPVFPTSMAQCDKFKSDYDKYAKQISEQHQDCLNTHSSGSAKAAKKPEPKETCSVPACQALHNRMNSAFSTGSVEVAACRQKVQKILDDQAAKKQQQDAAARAARETQAEAADNKSRKQYGDEQERTQAARDAAARKQAEDDEASRQRHDALMKSQKDQRDKAAADARLAEKHAEWKARNDQRKAQIEQLENSAANIPDEAQRHAALQSALKQIQQIKAQAKQDPEPK